MIALALPLKDIKVFEQASEFGINNIELKFWNDFPPTEENVRKIAEVLECYNFKVISAHLPNYHINKRKEDIKQLENAITNILTHFKAKIFVMHCLYGNREFMIENLKILDGWLDKHIISLVIENLRSEGANLRFPKDLQYMRFREFNNIGFCLDTSHVVNIEDLWEFLKYATHMHISDFDDNNVHLPLGDGIIDWQRFFKETKNYGGYFVIEYATEYLTKENIEKTLEILKLYGVL